MWTTFKVVIGFVVILLLLFMFWCFRATRHMGSQPPTSDESMAPAVEGKVFTTGLPGNSQSREFGIFRIC